MWRSHWQVSTSLSVFLCACRTTTFPPTVVNVFFARSLCSDLFQGLFQMIWFSFDFVETILVSWMVISSSGMLSFSKVSIAWTVFLLLSSVCVGLGFVDLHNESKYTCTFQLVRDTDKRCISIQLYILVVWVFESYTLQHIRLREQVPQQTVNSVSLFLL